jgi:hypothetical protein
MIFYHASRPEVAQAILSGGFREGSGTYLTRSRHVGVWFSDYALGVNEGATGNAVVWIDAPEHEFAEYEWTEQGKPYREFLVPAAVANRYGPARQVIECPDCETEYGGAHCPKCLTERRLKRRHEQSLQHRHRREGR